MNCRGPKHFNQQFANRILEWKGVDSKENFESNCAKSESYKKLKDFGWLDSSIQYSYNSDGFRDIEFDQRPSIIALGCSHTEGIGLFQHQAWPAQLEKMVEYKVWNLGIGGAALDTCFRVLNFWIHHLNAVAVCCAVPEQSRYEIFTGGAWNSILPNQFLSYNHWIDSWNKNYVLHDENSKCNREKNLLAMKQICSDKQVPFYNDTLDNFLDGAHARDLKHCGQVTQHILAESFFKQIKRIPNEFN